MKYSYEINGTAAEGLTWAQAGTVETELSDFHDIPSKAVNHAFMQLFNDGAAGLNNPNCKGPYVIRRMLIEWIEEGA
jgi:hypothetical protein